MFNLKMPGLSRTFTAAQQEILAKANIIIPAPLPLFDSPPNQHYAAKWVASQPSWELQLYATKLVTNLNYINFADFMQQLCRTIAEFNNNYSQPYVLCIAQASFSYIYKSEAWVSALALEYAGLRFPKAIVLSGDLADYLNDNPDVTKVLILDDAAYSGSHIYSELHSICENISSNVRLLLGIPFITKNALRIIKASRFAQFIDFLPYANIPTIAEILSKKDLERLVQIRRTQHDSATNLNFAIELSSFGSRTVTYFAHRYPDFMSSLQCFVNGDSLAGGNLQNANDIFGPLTRFFASPIPIILPIVPYIASPYSFEMRTGDYRRLIFAIKEGKIGLRANQPLPKALQLEYEKYVVKQQNVLPVKPDKLNASNLIMLMGYAKLSICLLCLLAITYGSTKLSRANFTTDGNEIYAPLLTIGAGLIGMYGLYARSKRDNQGIELKDKKLGLISGSYAQEFAPSSG